MNTAVLTPQRKAEQIQTLRHALLILEALPIVTPCAECVEFSDGYCNQHKANVPPDFQSKGCPQFTEVPF